VRSVGPPWRAWAEEGAQSYPSVTWNQDDFNVWYWRCSSCSPVHSYTWGAAYNWTLFAYSYGRRGTALSYMTDLAYADVGQMEVDGYGYSSRPDHTMMVTGRNSSGWALMSYHTTDTENKPLNPILAANDGPYWALRT